MERAAKCGYVSGMLRRKSLPPSLSAQVKELRALTTAPLEGGLVLAVARGEVAVVGEGGIELRARWTDLESATWDGELRELTLHRVDGGPDVVLRLASDDVFHAMTAVRERVTSSIVHVEFLSTVAGGEVRALVRRSADGSLFSQLIARGPVTGEELDAAASLERRARAAAGLPPT